MTHEELLQEIIKRDELIVSMLKYVPGTHYMIFLLDENQDINFLREKFKVTQMDGNMGRRIDLLHKNCIDGTDS